MIHFVPFAPEILFILKGNQIQSTAMDFFSNWLQASIPEPSRIFQPNFNYIALYKPFSATFKPGETKPEINLPRVNSVKFSLGKALFPR